METLEFDSKLALMDWLENCGSAQIVIGLDSEAPRKFYAFRCTDESTRPVALGLLSSHFGIKPSLSRSPSGTKLIVGFDAALAVVDLALPRLTTELHLDGVFCGLIRVEGTDRVVAIYEFGAVMLNYAGKVIWSVSTHLVDGWRLDGGNLRLVEQIGGRELLVDLATGLSI